MTFLETSFLVALFVEKDHHHKKALKLYPTLKNKIISQMVIYETLTVLRKKNQDNESLKKVYKFLITTEDITVLNDVIYYDKALKYTFDNYVGFFDNLSYVVMKNNDIKEIASFDPDFEIFKDIKRIK